MVREPGPRDSGDGDERSEQGKKSRQAMPRVEYQAISSDFGFIPRGQPLPLPEAMRQLPRRYRFVLSKPGPAPFAMEMGLAEWKIVWVQLLAYTVLAALLSFLHTLIYPSIASSPSSASGANNQAVLSALDLGSSLGLLLWLPLLFFGAMGLLYWLARAFGGHGIFVQQAYTTLLFLIPCGVIVSVSGIIPIVGSFLSTFSGLLLFVYCIALQCFATLAVHQMPGSKATAAVIITVLVLIPATILCLSLWTLIFVAI